MSLPFKSGDIVWTRFPFDSDPDRPGPMRHAAVVLAAFALGEAPRALVGRGSASGVIVGLYTSSRVEKFDDKLSVGVIQVAAERARSSGNTRAFFIDTRVRAFLPLIQPFFPDLDKPGSGLVGSLDKGLMRKVLDEYRRVNERYREQIVNVGPLRP